MLKLQDMLGVMTCWEWIKCDQFVVIRKETLKAFLTKKYYLVLRSSFMAQLVDCFAVDHENFIDQFITSSITHFISLSLSLTSFVVDVGRGNF